jgi:hypothetical protein
VIPFMVSLSNHEWNQLVRCFLKIAASVIPTDRVGARRYNGAGGTLPAPDSCAAAALGAESLREVGQARRDGYLYRHPEVNAEREIDSLSDTAYNLRTRPCGKFLPDSDRATALALLE